MQKIMPYLWYVTEAEEAARFYASIFPNSHVDRVTALPVETPSGPAGSVKLVDFTLFGQKFGAMSAGELDPFNHAVSFMVLCKDQAEIDRYWNVILGNGGTPKQCGWIRDKYGVCWQITPEALMELNFSDDIAARKRMTEAMLTMVKLDVAALQKAYDGG